MGTTTISMSAGTWIQESDSGNHSSDTRLRCGKRYSSNPYGNAYAILQFVFPSSLKYKRITSAKLNYYSYYRHNGSDDSHGPTGMEVAPFITDGQALYTITGVNYASKGTLGAWKSVEAYNGNYYAGSYPSWRVADITDIISGNVSGDGYFTVFMAGNPAHLVTSTEYTGIASLGTNYAAYIDITYDDVTQLAPTPTYPVGSNIKENEEILFTWTWNSSTEAVQAAVQLEYKLKSAQNYTVLSLTQTGHTYKLTAGLPQGSYQWRIKGTNDASETSGYSNVAEFTVIGKPAVPVINSVPNRTLTEITWNAVGQLSADISLVDSNGITIEEKTLASPESTYKPNYFLKGTYTIGVRIRNSTGLSSEWAYRTFSITAAGPTKPAMRLSRNDTQVTIALNPEDGVQYAVIRREDYNGANEKILGYVDNGVFIDKTFALDTVYRYVVRAYSTGGYTDSNPERVICHKAAVVLETSDDEVVLDRSENTFLPYAEDSQRDYSVFKAVGRKYPVVEHGDGENWSFRSNLFVTEDQKERIKAMAMKNKIYYRDYSGRAFPVAIETLSFTRYMGEGYIADIQFLRISEEEVIINV